MVKAVIKILVNFISYMHFCHDVNVLTSANKFVKLPSSGINFQEKFCLIGSGKSYAWSTPRHLLGICSPQLVWYQGPLFIVAPYC